VMMGGATGGRVHLEDSELDHPWLVGDGEHSVYASSGSLPCFASQSALVSPEPAKSKALKSATCQGTKKPPTGFLIATANSVKSVLHVTEFGGQTMATFYSIKPIENTWVGEGWQSPASRVKGIRLREPLYLPFRFVG
jgi:hypothetical protein